MREIQQENRELREALEEHQTALEHIMSKYRQHTTEQIYKSRINFVDIQNQRYNEIIRKQAEKIQEMAIVMDQAATVEEERALKDEEVMTRLKTENKVILVKAKLVMGIIHYFHFVGFERNVRNSM